MSFNIKETSATLDQIHFDIKSNVNAFEIQTRITLIIDQWKKYREQSSHLGSKEYDLVTRKLYMCILEENEKIGFRPSLFVKSSWEKTIAPIKLDPYKIIEQSKFNRLSSSDQLLLLFFEEPLGELFTGIYLGSKKPYEEILSLSPQVKKAMLSQKDDLLALFKTGKYTLRNFIRSGNKQELIASHAGALVKYFNGHERGGLLEDFPDKWGPELSLELLEDLNQYASNISELFHHIAYFTIFKLSSADRELWAFKQYKIGEIFRSNRSSLMKYYGAGLETERNRALNIPTKEIDDVAALLNNGISLQHMLRVITELDTFNVPFTIRDIAPLLEAGFDPVFFKLLKVSSGEKTAISRHFSSLPVFLSEGATQNSLLSLFNGGISIDDLLKVPPDVRREKWRDIQAFIAYIRISSPREDPSSNPIESESNIRTKMAQAFLQTKGSVRAAHYSALRNSTKLLSRLSGFRNSSEEGNPWQMARRGTRKAYTKLSLELHPDKTPQNDPQKEIKLEAWKIVNDIYNDILRHVLKEK